MRKEQNIPKISWRPILEEMQSILRGRDFRKKRLLHLFFLIDSSFRPTAGMFKTLYGTIIGPGFLSGRKALYGGVCREFIKKYRVLFEGAPFEVLRSWNSLFSTLFPAEKDLLLDERLAFRKKSKEEKFLEKGKRAEASIKEWLQHPFELFPSYEFPSALPTQLPQAQKKRYELFDEAAQQRIALLIAEEAARCQLEKCLEEYKQRLIPLFSLIEEPLLSRFKDLQPYIDKALHMTVPESVSTISDLIGVVEKYAKGIDDFCRKLEARQKILVWAEKKKRDVASNIEPLLVRKDIAEKVQRSLEKLHLVEPSTTAFETSESQVIDYECALFEASVRGVSREIEDAFHGFLRHAEEVKKEVVHRQVLFSLRMWNVLVQRSLYPDLIPIAEGRAPRLLDELSRVVQSALAGVLTMEEYRRELTRLSYDPDVLLFRSEHMLRARRILDLRSQFRRNLQSIDRWLLLARMIDPDVHVKKELEEAFTARDILYDNYTSWLDPAETFANTDDPESVQRVFRLKWTFLDEWQEELEGTVASIRSFIDRWLVAHGYAAWQHQVLFPILRTLTHLEKTAGLDGAYTFFESFEGEWLPSLADKLFMLLDKLEARWPLAKLVLILSMVDDSDVGEKVSFEMQQALQRQKELEVFGRAIQAGTTDDVERVDALFECFDDIWPLFHPNELSSQEIGLSVFNMVATVHRSFNTIGQELILHLGTVDESALSDRQDLVEAMKRASHPFLPDGDYQRAAIELVAEKIELTKSQEMVDTSDQLTAVRYELTAMERKEAPNRFFPFLYGDIQALFTR